MNRGRAILGMAVLLTLAAGNAVAQIAPHGGQGDPRFQIVDYQPEQVVLIRAAPGYQVTVQLAADERIESVAVGDSGAWQVSADKTGNRLFVKALQTSASTNMTVITSTRLYAFDLQPLTGPSPDMPYAVQFRYQSHPEQDIAPDGPMNGLYRLGGSKALWPERISDDGKHTYIDWAPDKPLPAAYSRDAQGHETLVNGMMRDRIFVIDTVVPQLIFRIDRQVARATRKKVRGKD